MRLSFRLEQILDLVPDHTDVLADIGCDHGKLLISAVLTGKTKKGIGVDISKASLHKAISLAIDSGVGDKVRFIEGDGLLPLRKEKIDVCVIAGMGGNEIVKILSQENSVRTFILCPHQDAHVVRLYLNEKKYSVQYDFTVKDGKKFYPVIYVETEGKGATYTEQEIYLGKNVPERKDFNEKNEKRMEYLQKIIEKADNFQTLTEEIKKEYEILSQWQKSKK